jgi:hypothetical protein
MGSWSVQHIRVDANELGDASVAVAERTSAATPAYTRDMRAGAINPPTTTQLVCRWQDVSNCGSAVFSAPCCNLCD